MWLLRRPRSPALPELGSTGDSRSSGNRFSGVALGGDTHFNLIKGNYIGTDKSGTKDLGNDDSGIRVATGAIPGLGTTDGNTIGGTTADSRNVVSGNHQDGIEVSNSPGTEMLGNRVGTTADGKGALGNDEDGVSGLGLQILIGNGTPGGSNTVAFNGDDGIDVVGIGASGIEISRNSIFSNVGPGIDLNDDGPTLNDPGDADDGSNHLQNKPVLSSAKTSSTKSTVAGKLNSTPGEIYTVEFYSNPPGGNEGKRFLGQKTVSISASGNASFTKALPRAAVGQTITATATSKLTVIHDTSEFSAPRKVRSS